MPLKLGKDALVKLIYAGRVKRVRKNNIAPLLKELRLLQALDFNLTTYILGSLPPLQLHHLNPQFLYGILQDAETAIFNICLHDNGAVTIALPFLIKLHPPLEVS
ncbi:hypothetical protein ES703_41016 [subsurface metagenome]